MKGEWALTKNSGPNPHTFCFLIGGTLGPGLGAPLSCGPSLSEILDTDLTGILYRSRPKTVSRVPKLAQRSAESEPTPYGRYSAGQSWLAVRRSVGEGPKTGKSARYG